MSDMVSTMGDGIVGLISRILSGVSIETSVRGGVAVGRFQL
jgi:hypothetical protein